MNTIKSFKVIRDCYVDQFERAVEAALNEGWVAVAWFNTDEPHPQMVAASYFTVYLTREELAAQDKDATETEDAS